MAGASSMDSDPPAGTVHVFPKVDESLRTLSIATLKAGPTRNKRAYVPTSNIMSISILRR